MSTSFCLVVLHSNSLPHTTGLAQNDSITSLTEDEDNNEIVDDGSANETNMTLTSPDYEDPAESLHLPVISEHEFELDGKEYITSEFADGSVSTRTKKKKKKKKKGKCKGRK